MWIIIVIVIVVIILVAVVKNDNKTIQIDNLQKGGFRKLFPLFTEIIEKKYNMTFSGDSGNSFSYTKTIIDNYNKEGFLTIGIKLDYGRNPVVFSNLLDSEGINHEGTLTAYYDHSTEIIDTIINTSIEVFKTKGIIKDEIEEISSSSMNECYLKIFRGCGIEDNTLNLITANDIIEKYGKKFTEVNHNNYSIEIQYPNLGMSFNYKYNDSTKTIYLMSVTGEVSAITETGLVFNKDLKFSDVINHYGFGKPFGSSDKEDDSAYVKYEHIIFYLSKKQFEGLSSENIDISKISIY